MAVIALKTEGRCKLCQHPQRTDIDALLEKRSQRAKDDNGVLINGDYVKTQLAAWGVENPTTENITVHWRKHCQRVAGAAGEMVDAEQAKALEELLAILDSDRYPETTEGKLQQLFDLGMAEVVLRVRRGDRSGITLDQLRWISAELGRRKGAEAQQDLLAALGAGLAQAEITAVKATISAKPALPPTSGRELVAETAEWEDVEA